MAELQQNNLKLAQKQISNVRPASVQYQEPIRGMKGQNNEALFKAVSDAIDIGAEVYKKMDDASVDLELKDEQARLVEHLNNQAVLRENSIGAVNPSELSPQRLKQQWGGTEGKVKFGQGQLTPFEPSEDLSPRAAQLIQPSIDVANSNFLRDSQISFAKELKKRGLKSLQNDKNTHLENWERQIATFSSDLNPLKEVGKGNYVKLTRKYAEMNSDMFERRLNESISLGHINEPDAEEMLRKHRQDLALVTLKNHFSLDREGASEMILGTSQLRMQGQKSNNFYSVHGVGVDPKLRWDFIRRENEREYQLNEMLAEGSMRAFVDAGIKSPYIIDERSFVRSYFDIVPGDTGNRLIPKKNKIEELSLEHNVSYPKVELYLKQQAVGQKDYKDGRGIGIDKFNILMNKSEQWYNKQNLNSDHHPESPYQELVKTGDLELLSTEERQRYQDYREGWWKVNLLARHYTEEPLGSLIKNTRVLSKELSDPDDNRWNKAHATYRQLWNNKILPRIKKMQKSPKMFIREQLGIGAGDPLIEGQAKLMDELAKKFGLPKLEGNYTSEPQHEDDINYFFGIDTTFENQTLLKE